MVLRLEDFDYDLPRGKIAQFPAKPRDRSRLLVVDRQTGMMEDRLSSDVVQYFEPGQMLVLNDTKVLPHKLVGRKRTGGRVEAILLRPLARDPNAWRALLKPRLKEGQTVSFAAGDGGRLEATLIGREEEMSILRFEGDDVQAHVRKFGAMPLPPYVKREPIKEDETAYQTVYARSEGAIAAPTAGLHFTGDLLRRIEEKGVRCLFVTLHVSYGTFKPVGDMETHKMAPEAFELREEVALEINRARREGRRIWAVGTTVARVLETCVMKGELLPGSGETDLFILPPFEFECVGGLMTNFHLPRTSLLMLVSAFMGHDLMRRAYRHALESDYRFYSYGDAMLIR